MNQNQIINLTDDLLYGQGTHKKCFLHPLDNNLCIKIAYNKGGQRDLNRKLNYLKVLKRHHKDYSILPQYYGPVKTNLGIGHVFELIQDYDGTKSQTLEDFINSPTAFKENFNMIVSLLKQLKTDLYKNEIITMLLFPSNIIFQKTAPDNYRARIINDMGSAVLIPLEYHFKYFAHTKILRRWEKFLIKLQQKHPSNLVEELIKEIK